MPKVHRRGRSNAQLRPIGPYQFGRYSASRSSSTVEQQVSSRSLKRRSKQKALPADDNNPASSPISQKTTATSAFERLPTEILELIFFQCLNLNLPLASSNLGSALSSFYLKSRLSSWPSHPTNSPTMTLNWTIVTSCSVSYGPSGRLLFFKPLYYGGDGWPWISYTNVCLFTWRRCGRA